MSYSEKLQILAQTKEKGQTTLYLSSSQLTELPPEIGELTQLQGLCLSFPQLTTLPPEIGELTQLQRLDLSSTQLTSLPPEIGRLTQLQSLDLSSPQLTTLPPEIGQLMQLQSLDLRNTQLTALPPEIGQLMQLQSLDLRNTQLSTLPQEIEKLTQLQNLYISSPQLSTLPPEIVRLSQLQSLYLSSPQLMALPPEIGQLAQLQNLYLSSSQLTELPAEIGQLTQLERLDLGSNPLATLPSEVGLLIRLLRLYLNSTYLTTLPPEIGQLAQLQRLDLRHTQLTNLPDEIEGLVQLEHLYLSHTPLTELPVAVTRLDHLQYLEISSTQLTALPCEIGQMTHLERLDVRHTPLTMLPPEIGQLKQLERLDLSNTQLMSLPPEAGGMSELREFYLSSPRFTTLPTEIKQWTQLQGLYISSPRLTTLPQGIGQLTQLQHLYLDGCPLTNLPPEIGQWTQLESLDLSATQLAVLPPEIGRLSKLQHLNLNSSKLAALPSEIEQLTGLCRLDLRNTSLPMPVEILANYRDPAAILGYYKEYLSTYCRPLNEAKMVLVGQGSVGKTSIVNRLLYNTFDPQENKTEGIAITRWQITPESTRTASPIRVNIWDFGGQEIMHATHQFFLTKRSLYLLVLDTRLGEAENFLDYWLQIIRSFGGDSPIIVVGNKMDQQRLDLDRLGLKSRYPNIRAIVETSCINGAGIEELRQTIAREISALQHINDELLKTWFDVKAQLETLDDDYIPYEHYTYLCRTLGVEDTHSQRTLLGFLHDLGIVLCFQDDPRLAATHILNPEWVTQGVYAILNHPDLLKQGGVLSREMLSNILDPQRYPRHKHLFIIDMMRKFELCFDFEGQNDQRFLVPDLLPKEAPDIGDWHDSLRFRYQYTVLPGSVLTRFMVRMHPYVDTSRTWRTGTVLLYQDNEALVRADLNTNRIYVYVAGPVSGRRGFLGIIRSQFSSIHRTISGLQVVEQVPLPGYPDIAVDYDHLLTLEELGDATFVPPGLRERVNVRELLAGVGSVSTPPGGLPPALALRLRMALLRSDFCTSDTRLRSLFADERLYPWRNMLPITVTPDERVDAIIDTLHDRRNTRREVALVLLLRVLAERTDPGDAEQQSLHSIADELDYLLRHS
ncbi:MAG: leucine-rich repeat domain-containing protein [Anaerolineae bacterium]|nr:leucine-rich repeat domain-containing protein [Anaerolineae bacterium]